MSRRRRSVHFELRLVNIPKRESAVTAATVSLSLGKTTASARDGRRRHVCVFYDHIVFVLFFPFVFTTRFFFLFQTQSWTPKHNILYHVSAELKMCADDAYYRYLIFFQQPFFNFEKQSVTTF